MTPPNLIPDLRGCGEWGGGGVVKEGRGEEEEEEGEEEDEEREDLASFCYFVTFPR